jgi:hypothetical protein
LQATIAASASTQSAKDAQEQHAVPALRAVEDEPFDRLIALEALAVEVELVAIGVDRQTLAALRREDLAEGREGLRGDGLDRELTRRMRRRHGLRGRAAGGERIAGIDLWDQSARRGLGQGHAQVGIGCGGQRRAGHRLHQKAAPTGFGRIFSRRNWGIRHVGLHPRPPRGIARAEPTLDGVSGWPDPME